MYISTKNRPPIPQQQKNNKSINRQEEIELARREALEHFTSENGTAFIVKDGKANISISDSTF